jgi:succinate dehydrogenase flavin-adding protein (antitoxin of CptAB toxin-antitoxin module)
MRARLVYMSRKRGILETDLLLSTFASEKLPSMDADELKEYDRVRVCFGLTVILNNLAHLS